MTVQFGGSNYSSSSLVNSEAGGNFMDSGMAEQWGIRANLMQGSDSRKALQWFLGLDNFYFRFIQIFSQVPKLPSTKETA